MDGLYCILAFRKRLYNKANL